MHLHKHDAASKLIPVAHVVAVQVLVVPPEHAHVDAFWVYPFEQVAVHLQIQVDYSIDFPEVQAKSVLGQ